MVLSLVLRFLPVLGVGEVEAAAGVPLRPLVPMGGDAAGVGNHASQVEQVPGHEGRVPVGEVVVGPAGTGIEVRRAGPGLADPARVGLGRDDVAEVLEGVQDVHGAVLHAVLVAGHQAAADPAVERVLAGVVQQVGVAVEPFDHLGADRRLLPEPDRRAQHQDVGALHLLEDGGPVVPLPAVLGHVGPHAGGDLVVDGPHHIDRDALPPHDLHRDVGQALRVRDLRRPFQGAVDEQRPQIGEIPTGLAAELLLLRRERCHWYPLTNAGPAGTGLTSTGGQCWAPYRPRPSGRKGNPLTICETVKGQPLRGHGRPNGPYPDDPHCSGDGVGPSG